MSSFLAARLLRFVCRILIVVLAWVTPGWTQDPAKQRWDGEITLPTT